MVQRAWGRRDDKEGALSIARTAPSAGAAQAAATERRRIARDLHDGPQQRLVSLMLDATALAGRLGDSADPEARQLLASILNSARASLIDLRCLVHALAPPTLSEDGLGSAIRELTLGVPGFVEVDDRLTERPPPAIESAAFLMTAELLANVSKHSGAREVHVLLEQRGCELHIEVSDDGWGGADPRRGSGLFGLYERSAALGGRVTISSRAGVGTTVCLQLPIVSGAN